jgi:murein DD-endopeptidase MepM/ murein hydrolase activator NlpD
MTLAHSPLRPARTLSAPAPDLGTMAPLVASTAGLPFDRRSVNLRWLAATILAGISGLALIGSAMIASVDKRSTFAIAPEIAGQGPLRATATVGGVPSRVDRVVTAQDIITAKQSYRAPVTIRVGDREVIRMKPFVRVAANLALTTSDLATDIPKFDPQKLLAAGPPTATDRASESQFLIEGEGEVSFQKRPLLPELDLSADRFILSDEQIEAQVDATRIAELSAVRAPIVPLGAQQMLVRTLPLTGSDANPGPTALSDTNFSNIQVTVVPENVTAVPKIPARSAGEASTSEERLLTIKRGETLEQALRQIGVAAAAARDAYATLATRLREGTVREGQRLKVLLAPASSAVRGEMLLLRVIVFDEDRPIAIAAMNDRGQYVSVAPPVTAGAPPTPAPTPADAEEDEEDGGVRLYESLYETAVKNDIPRSVVDQMVRVFFFDVDLQRKVAGGDTFEVFYAEDDENSERFDVLYAALSVGGTTRRYFRFQGGEDKSYDFFDENGRSNRRFLIRKPISEGILRSGFGMRYHPILRYSKMHTGVDWANKVGTPIIAAGDGVVIKAEWDSGYGRHVEIQHSYGYVTTYSHMSSFARGIVEGTKVKQGQVIGYLGSSGLSTGPHLHYEVLVNDNFVDPLSIKLPGNRELSARQLVGFKLERARIEDLMSKAPAAARFAERNTK